MKSSALKRSSLWEARLKNVQAMKAAAKRIDAFRKKYGKPVKGFDSVSIIRKFRESR